MLILHIDFNRTPSFKLFQNTNKKRMVLQTEHSHRQAPGMIPDGPTFNSFQSVGRMSETPKCGSRGSRSEYG